MGTMKQESIGKMVFNDVNNGIYAEVNLGKVKGRPSDYFNGYITENGK